MRLLNGRRLALKRRRVPRHVVSFVVLITVVLLRSNPLRTDFIVSETNGHMVVALPKSSSCTEYRSYPWPDHHSGLPYLGDVFASHDAQWVYFIGINRGTCKKEYLESDKFAAKGREANRFMCLFPDHVHVLSEFVHSTEPHSTGFVIRCRIPPQFQHLVQSAKDSTTLHVDLHALHDLELERTGPADIRIYPSGIVTEMPRLVQLPVCHPVERQMTPKQYNLIAFTRIKSNYVLGHVLHANKTTVSPLPYILEWIEYHQEQGFDHFVIYDNDPTPHGPIESLLEPLVDSGLVTYKWFPMKDCWTDYGRYQGFLSPWGQVVGSLAVLHRMGFATRFYAHMDVDEFFVPLNNKRTVLDMMMESDSTLDVLLWLPTVMAPCDGTVVEANQSPLRKWQCLTNRHYAAAKLIMRPERILYFFVHYPILTMNGTKPTEYMFSDRTEGLLAHYRQSPGQKYWRDDFSGMVQSNFTKRAHFMDHFLSTRKLKHRQL